MSTSMTLILMPTNSPKASTNNVPLADADCATDIESFRCEVVVAPASTGPMVALLPVCKFLLIVTPRFYP